MNPDCPRVTRLVSLGFALALLFACAARGGDDVPSDAASLRNPVTELTPRDVRYYQKQFKTKCARCHGLDGSGGGGEAEEQPVPPADFTDAAFMSSRTDGQLYHQISMGGGERCAMPPGAL